MTLFLFLPARQISAYYASFVDSFITPCDNKVMYQSIFLQIGLSDGEALVYDYLLNEGNKTAGQIVKQTNLKRGNVYNILKGLVEKGLVEQFLKNKVMHFRLEHPTKLHDYTRRKTKEMEYTSEALKDVLPNIISQFTLTNHKPAVHYFEGEEGMKIIYDDTIEENKNLEIFVFRSHLDDKVFGRPFYDAYMKKRAKRGIKTRILSDKDITEELKKEDIDLLKERKKWEGLKIPAEINIYDDKVAIISFEGELVGTIIQNKPIAQTLRVIFQAVWDSK